MAAARRGKPRQLKSVLELENLRQGNDFILRIAEELSRQSVERAQAAEDELEAMQLERVRLHDAAGTPAATVEADLAAAREAAARAARTAEDEMREVQAQLAASSAVVQEQRSQLEEGNAARDALQEELESLRDELAQAQEKNRTVEGDIEDLQARLAVGQQASVGTEEAAAAMLEKTAQLRGELRKAVEAREATSRELDTAAAAAKRVESELSDLTVAHDLLKTEHSETKRAHAESCDEGEELRTELGELSRREAAQGSELEARVAHIAQLEAAAKDKDEELASWIEFSDGSVPLDKHERLQSELHQAIEARTTAEAEAAAQQSENESQVQRLEEQRRQLEEGNAARDALQEELESLRDELAQAQDKNRTVEGGIADLQARLAVGQQASVGTDEPESEKVDDLVESLREQLALAQEKNSHRPRPVLEPESEVLSALDLNAAGSGDSVRAFCIEQANEYIAAAIGRLAQLGATTTEGIFREPGSTKECDVLVQELSELEQHAKSDHGEMRYGDLRIAFASCTDVFAIATVTSRWLRSKNEEDPWIPSAMRAEMTELAKDGLAYLAQMDPGAIGDDAEADLQQAAATRGLDWTNGIAKSKQLAQGVCRFVAKLPDRSEKVVAPLLCFLRAVDDHACETKMDATNLGTVFAPSLISQPGLAPDEATKAIADDISFCTLLIRLYEPPRPAPWLVLAAPALSQEPLQLAAAEASWTAQRIELDKENRALRDQLASEASANAMPGTRRSSIASSNHSSIAAEGVPHSGWGGIKAANRLGGAANKTSGGFNVLICIATDEDRVGSDDLKKGTAYYHVELWKDGSKITDTLRRYSEFEALRKRMDKELPMSKMLTFPGKKINKKAKGDAVTQRARDLQQWMNAVLRLVANGKDEQCQIILLWCTSSKASSGMRDKTGDI